MIMKDIYIVLFDLQGTELIVGNPRTSGNSLSRGPVGSKAFGIYISRMIPD